MKIQVPFKPKTILAMLIAVIMMDAFTIFFFTRIDTVVNNDLYRYGLQFNYEWAGQYSAYAQFLINSLAISIILIAMAIASILIHARRRDVASRFVCCLLLITGTTLAVFSAHLFNRLDYLINHDLYQHGLQYSYEWAINYWTYARSTLGLIILSTVTTLISIPLVLLSARKAIRINPAKLVSSTLIATGVTALILSVLYSSSILAFIGLGLTFWGALLTYIRTEEYIRENLLDATAMTPLATLNQIIRELHYEGKAVYLPPKYLKDPEDNKAYIPKRKEGQLPTPEQMQEHETELFIENPEGILLTPPGAELTKLFEKTLETTFTRTDLQHLQHILPKLFIEDLEIAQNLEIVTESNKVRVTIENSTYRNLTNETKKLTNIYQSIGCPLTSAIACALAKTTGKCIIIEKQQTSENGKNITTEYHLIEKEQTEQ